MTAPRAALFAWVLTGLAEAYLSPMCCGDNFCCAVKSGTVSCWGGYTFSTTQGTPLASLTGIKYVSCGGKTLVAVSTSDAIVSVTGTTGYGADSFPASNIGTTVTDLSVSFYGGSYIKKTDGTLAVWSQKDTYGASSTTESWYPPSDTAGCQCTTAYKDQTLTAPSGVFSKIACGGKRNGSLPPPTHSSSPPTARPRVDHSCYHTT